MITRADIKKETNSKTYSRGYRIWQEGGVLDLQVLETEENNIIKLTGCVEGSGGNIYSAEAEINDKENEILSNQCECPASTVYWGLCKHCVALLLAYLERRKAERRVFEEKISGAVRTSAPHTKELDSLLESLGVRRGMATEESRDTLPTELHRISLKKTEKRRISTSPGLSELMANYAMRDQVRYLPQARIGEVRLEVKLRFFYRELRAEFRIGIQRMYVLKSVSQFAASVLGLAQVSYGAGLSFLHCMQAFAPECRKMVRYITEYARQKKTMYQTSYGKWCSYETDRYLYPENMELDIFMDALKTMKFTLETEREQERQGIFSDGTPALEILLKRKEDAVQLEVPQFRFLEGRNKTYFFLGPQIFRESNDTLAGIMIFFRYLRERSDNVCTISSEDYAVFSQNLLPELERLFSVKKNLEGLTVEQPPEAVFQIHLDLPEKETVVCTLSAVYGDRKYSVFRDMNSIWKMAKGRDVRKEMEVYSHLLPYFTAYDGEREEMVIRGEEALYVLLSEGLEEMQKYGEVFLSDALKSVRVYSSPAITAGVSLNGNLLEMTFASEKFTGEELAAILSRYDRKKKYYRLKNGDFVNMEDGVLSVLSGIGQSLGISEKEMQSGKIQLARNRALYVEECLREESLSVERGREYRALIRSMKTVEENDFEIPKEVKIKLRSYQETGFRWIKTLCRNGFGGILADDMGLGKTLQVITFLVSEILEKKERKKKRTLIVTPASLVYNWKSEIERFAPGLTVCTVTGTAAERRKKIHNLGECEIAVTSYELLKRDLESYREMEFFCEVLDEAQFIKNHATHAARAVREIHSEFRLALTGTPVENRLSELWSIFDYLMPGFLGSYRKFREETELPIIRENDKEVMARLQKMIRPFVLRRMKKDVLRDLPEKIERNMFAEMEKEQKQLYQARAQRLAEELSGQSEQDFRESRIRVLAELTRLRQLCCDPSLIYEGYENLSAKTELCMELVKNAVEGGHRILLFSQFTSMLKLLEQRMEKEKISAQFLTGADSKEKRMYLVERFQKGEVSVFGISLKAGGTGLNLTEADMVIHFDPWWNVAAENQATDRAHRIGQKKVVTVYRLIVKETIEEKILKLQEAKKELAEQVLSGEEIKNASFTKEELLELLQSIPQKDEER